MLNASYWSFGCHGEHLGLCFTISAAALGKCSQLRERRINAASYLQLFM